MAKKPVDHNDTEVTTNDILINILLDRSGSMSGKQSDVIGNFNNFINEQKKLPGAARVSLVLFDDQYQEVYINKNLKDVPELDKYTYFVRGNTALLDAVGRLIRATDAIKNKPNKILFVINTDGYENASHEFTKAQIKELVTERQNNHDWQFLFIGAGIDAFTENTGAGLGLHSYQTFTSSNTPTGLTNISNYSGSVASTMRTTDLTGQSLYAAALDNADLEEDALAPNTAGNSASNTPKRKKIKTTSASK